MVRYHYREGVTFQKKNHHWLRWFLVLVALLGMLYAAALFIAPQVVTVPFTGLTIDATDKKIKGSQAGEFGDRLFIPQINIDVPVAVGNVTLTSALQRDSSLGNPEKGGNYVLHAPKFTWDALPTAVRDKSPFYNLGKLKEGDDLTIDYQNKRYVYRVREIVQGAAALADIEQKSDGFRLTLYAVDGESATGPVIRAERISPVVNESTGFGGSN